MESGITSSFIPQDAGKVAVSPRQQKGGGLGDLIFLIAIVLLVVSGALAGAVFLYNQYLASSALSKVDQLKTAREAFEPALIQQLTRLDDRMRAADSVLTVHLAPTALFFALSQMTLSTVSFRSLELDATDPKKITVKMPGVAQSVNSIALQADLMSKNGTIVSPIFSNISRQGDGVHFDMTAQVNPAAVNYVSLVTNALRSRAPQQAPVQEASLFPQSAEGGGAEQGAGGAAPAETQTPQGPASQSPSAPPAND